MYIEMRAGEVNDVLSKDEFDSAVEVRRDMEL